MKKILEFLLYVGFGSLSVILLDYALGVPLTFANIPYIVIGSAIGIAIAMKIKSYWQKRKSKAVNNKE